MASATAGDLTQQLSKFLDRHLVFPLLEFLYNRQLYDADDIQKAKIALLGNTNMVDYAMDIHESLYGKGSVPQEMNERRSEVSAARDAAVQSCSPANLRAQTVIASRMCRLQVIGRLRTLQSNAETIVAFLSNENSVKQLKQDKTYNLKFLQEVRR